MQPTGMALAVRWDKNHNGNYLGALAKDKIVG